MTVQALAPCPPGVDTDVWAGLCARVRDEAGWHISPSITETVIVNAGGNDRIVLDTLHLTAVNSITAQDGTLLPLGRFTAWGTVYLADTASWTYGWHDTRAWGDITLSITHGYATCPEALLDAMTKAARAARPSGVPGGRLVAGPFQAEYDDNPAGLVDQITAYALSDRA